MAEKLFKLLESSNKRFEVKLMTLDVISRLIGLHNLFLFNFYPYIQRFMQPHQREVVRILQFAAQASHELVPPDVIEPVLKTLANNFITERNSSDVIAIGMNAAREICSRCPLAMNEDLMRDLAQYKNYRERSVMMASRSLIHLFRNVRPELLHKKDRGRPTEATEELDALDYGKMDAKDYVPGAEVLLSKETEENIEINSDSDSDDDQWVDIEHNEITVDEGEDIEEEESDDDNEDDDVPDEGEESGNENAKNNGDKETEDDQEMKEADSELKKDVPNERRVLKAKRKIQNIQEKKELAQKVTVERLLTDEDFRRIDLANAKKQVFSASSGMKGLKRKIEETRIEAPSDLVKLSDIENIYKKKKHDKQSRIESIKKGQVDREKFGYKDGRMNENCSRTNREKRKTKNFQMIRHKARGKVKRSFKDKQISLRNHLLKLKKMK